MKHFICLLVTCMFFIACKPQSDTNNITTLELKRILEEDSIQLLDVRSTKEVKQGFIKTAIFADYFDANFYNNASRKLDKNRKVFVYCRSGNRSKKAIKILSKAGFMCVNVLGGYNQWKKEN
ncbi:MULTISPECIES: rhodanese-like domain-containing protein [Polaribacter]|uniref:Rhodanese-like domain-containing protein n=1 Tax=Polaribacter marinaquae TaxID=1642819 RepID=A0ABZ2TPV8_9FLAO